MNFCIDKIVTTSNAIECVPPQDAVNVGKELKGHRAENDAKPVLAGRLASWMLR